MKKGSACLFTAVIAAGSLLTGSAFSNKAVSIKANNNVPAAVSTGSTSAPMPAHPAPGNAFPGIIYIKM